MPFLQFNRVNVRGSPRQLVSYASYDIVENQSGKTYGKTKISKRGNSHIRRALHMPAFSVVRYNPNNFEQLYQRAYASSGNKIKGYVAAQRKILIMILHPLDKE